MGASAGANLGPQNVAAWTPDRTNTEGHGIRLGDFELHPGLGAGIGWVSNVFLEAPSEGVEDSAVLRVLPHLYLSTLTNERLQEAMGEGETQKVSFRAGLTGAFKQYFATEMSHHPDMAVGEDARLTLRPSSVFAWELFDEFHRSIDPFTQAVSPVPGASSATAQFDRDQIGVGTRLQLSTPGQLFKVGAGYRFDFDYFEDDLFKANENLSHTIAADTSWEFLPKTALFWNGSMRFFKFTNTDLQSVSSRNDSTNVQSRIGLNGALTPKLGFTLAVGYGAGFVSNASDYESAIAQVELRWKLRDTVLWALGYDREYNPSFQGNFARLDRIKTRLQTMLMGALLLGLRAELSFVDFGNDPNLASASNPSGSRSDIHLLTDLNAEYRIVNWFAITAELSYLQDFTDFEYVLMPATGPAIVDPAKYQQFQAWLGVRAFL